MRREIIAILRGVTPAHANSVCEVLVGAGITIIEIPLNSPDPLVSIGNAAKAFIGRAEIGAGTVLSTDDVEDVMGQMSERRIAKVPVVDGNRLVGIVSVGDVIKVMYERVHAENSHLMSYLYGQA